MFEYLIYESSLSIFIPENEFEVVLLMDFIHVLRNLGNNILIR